MLPNAVTNFALNRPKTILYGALALCLGLMALVATPFVVPEAPIARLAVDTDPENMLPADHPARVLHADRSALFGIHDTIVIAAQNDRTANGVFTRAALAEIAALTDFAAGLDGVIAADILSPSTVDTLTAAGDGNPRRSTLMAALPATDLGAIALRDRIAGLPLYRDSLLSMDRRSALMVIPIERREDAHGIARALRDRIESIRAVNSYSITGLPVAQSQFGIEMFVQMAIVAPAAMGLILVFLAWMFGSWRIALAPMAVAMLSTIGAMGALILTGHTIHIMSSMIAIFVMPIAVMDAIHILSDFADRQKTGLSRRTALRETVLELWRPMLFTTITTCAGFASLALAPIPPVQVFGIFVALGVLIAWAATLLLVPAALILMPETAFHGVTRRAAGSSGADAAGRIATRFPKLTLMTVLVAFGTAATGLVHIRINDNPINWFTERHEIRQAEAVVSDAFGGAFVAYLSLSGAPGTFRNPDQLAFVAQLSDDIEASGLATRAAGLPDLLAMAAGQMNGHPGVEAALPATADGIEALLSALTDVGLSDTVSAFVTDDRSSLVLSVQMRHGENRQMRALEAHVAALIGRTPPPLAVTADWFGLTQLNAVWQDAMVEGMIKALAGGFAVVFLLMLVLLRSVLWAILAMLPLTLSIAGIYGMLGWIGRDLDMPFAVLSALSLGLAVDFAIHFVVRLRQAAASGLPDPLRVAYGEPARAIWRNVLVLGVGFLPLLASPLVPYQVVGVSIPAILATAALVTLLFIGAAANGLKRWVLPVSHGTMPPASPGAPV